MAGDMARMTFDDAMDWWREHDEAKASAGDFEADVAHAESRFGSPPLDPQPPLPLTGGTLVSVPGHGDVPEPWPGERDRNWWRDLGRRTHVKGRERVVLDALLDRIWTGKNIPREGRFNGQWTGFQREIQADCGGRSPCSPSNARWRGSLRRASSRADGRAGDRRRAAVAASPSTTFSRRIHGSGGTGLKYQI